MSIFRDIERATQILSADENAAFVPLGKANGRRSQNKHKSPRNANIYEDDPNESYSDILAERNLNVHEIACSIKLANGGVSFSNEDLEHYWRSRANDDTSSNPNDTISEKIDGLEDNIEFVMTKSKREEDNFNVDKEEILKKCKLTKNAALAGLIRNNVISVKDLQIPKGFANMEHNTSLCMHNTSGPSVDHKHQDEKEMSFVEFPEDPDVLMHPLQAHGSIDENKHKDIDFTVPRIGKKKVITPTQYYIQETDDSFFAFKKKNTKSKK